MGRKTLTDEERAAREAEKAELFKDRKKYNRKTNPQSTEMESKDNKDTVNENSGASNENNAGNSNPVNNGTTDTGTGAQNTVVTPSNETTEGAAKTTNPSSNYQPDLTFKPLGGNRKDRTYSKPVIDPTLEGKEIPEIPLGPGAGGGGNANVNAHELIDKPLTAEDENKNQKPEPIVEGFNNLTPQEQQDAASQTVEMILSGYDKLHGLAREIVKVSDEDVIAAHNEDRINMYEATVENDADPDKEISIQDFWKDFNNQVDEKLVVTDTFKNAVRPAMTRLCVKHGLGVGDGWYVGYKFAEDIATKGAMVYGFKKVVNTMQTMFEARHANFKEEVQKEIDKREEAKRLKEQKTSEAADSKSKAVSDAAESMEKTAKKNEDNKEIANNTSNEQNPTKNDEKK